MSVSSDSMTVALNSAFQQRVRYFLCKAAVAVMSEQADTAGHSLRVAYAKLVLSGTASSEAASVAVLTNGVVAAAGFAVTDNDLEFTVNSVFSALAGVST